MSSNSQEKTSVRDWWQAVKVQFHKVIWPEPKLVAKETVVVLITSLILGLIIALLDSGLLEVVDRIISI
ncbi:MAG: preprotein translocase subunit SecE [Lachnospiraceae bacterium]|jgi:preprotein translocase subunit SecE